MANEAKVAAKGIDIILLFRVLKKSKEEAAWKLAFQNEHENTKTKDSDSVATKDGPIRIPGSLEIDFSATSILSVGDPYVDQLEEALDNDDIIEIWEINKAEKGTGDNADKYKATYYQGYVTSFGKSPNAEDTVEVSLEFGINGKGAKGFATLTADQEEVVQYVFKDTTIETADPGK
ncbi:phage major tail protein, TP901-1 family [Enterococcus faecalis]|uniref:phage major tail protein, TP901-1 family n=1 Tax=Enterococcus faecalis TaxID=1351 RepID=UPI000CF29B43|nr:phage major tail protein, TP901-1 family [Enterococcus faecalis]EGO6670419.1 phage major tail protein, TP901-1 family [Enterococcus faecalis]EHE8458767.1 phage major tail protein, TP901-1 family [Enterococcus faecalis]EHU4980677.1 phage major tail protein, TP901-1 family [Enterococcus faecalis]EJC3092515.1 phage major tail protein, TP901-1 family [Enterococcus faecalis]PQC36479.1 phage major tail protein, TP901-1 family [Enterococcus faecalis]